MATISLPAPAATCTPMSTAVLCITTKLERTQMSSSKEMGKRMWFICTRNVTMQSKNPELLLHVTMDDTRRHHAERGWTLNGPNTTAPFTRSSQVKLVRGGAQRLPGGRVDPRPRGDRPLLGAGQVVHASRGTHTGPECKSHSSERRREKSAGKGWDRAGETERHGAASQSRKGT